MTGATDSTTLGVFRAASGRGRMTVTQDSGGCCTFRITGHTNTLTISDEEATTLAKLILEGLTT